MATNTREGYRERLSKGDVVYLIDGETVAGTGRPIVKKASVDMLEEGKRYPFVKLWESVDQEPRGGFVTSRSPRELFTAEEVARLIRQHEGPHGIDDRPIDELVVDAIANQELTAVLGGAAIQRLADDELRRPGDPEY